MINAAGISELFGAVVVKELRQELRMRSFSIIFLVPQAVLLLSVIMQSGNDKQAYAGSQMFFWPAILIPLLIIIPRRAIVSLAKESDANSLDLVLLTRLSAWKVVLGKWLSMVFLTALFLVSVLPYLLLQYFIAGGDVVATWCGVGAAALFSIAISAVNISTSGGGRKKRVPSFVFFILLLLVIYGGGSLSALLFGIGRTTSIRSFLGYDLIALLLLFPFFPLLTLEGGLTRFAPPLENYAARKRVTAVLVFTLGVVLLFLGVGTRPWVLFLTVAALTPVCISSLFEPIHPVLERSLKRHMLSSWFKYNGWPGGVLFTFSAVFALTTCFYLSGAYAAKSWLLIVVLFEGAVFLPWVLMNAVLPKNARTSFMYLLSHLLLILVSVALGIILQSSTFSMCFPLVSLAKEISLSGGSAMPNSMGATGVAVLISLVAACLALIRAATVITTRVVR